MKSESADFSGVTVSEATPAEIEKVKKRPSEFHFRFQWKYVQPTFVVKKDGEIIGVARVNQKDHTVLIDKFVIRKGWRKKGFGKKVIELLDVELAKRGVRKSVVASLTNWFWKRTRYTAKKNQVYL